MTETTSAFNIDRSVAISPFHPLFFRLKLPILVHHQISTGYDCPFEARGGGHNVQRCWDFFRFVMTRRLSSGQMTGLTCIHGAILLAFLEEIVVCAAVANVASECSHVNLGSSQLPNQASAIIARLKCRVQVPNPNHRHPCKI